MDEPALTRDQMDQVTRIYDSMIRDLVHHLW
jgi:hypothetical protein